MTMAKEHGALQPWRPTFSADEIAALERRVREPLPQMLRAFLQIYDRTAWSWFVNPEQQRVGDVFNVADSSGPIKGDHPKNVVADMCGIDSLDEIVVTTVERAKDRMLGAFVDAIKHGVFAAEWLTAKLIAFDGTQTGEKFYFVVGPCDWAEGTVCMSIGDDPGLVWLADSIPHWLARLVAFDGMELAIYPGNASDYPRSLRQAHADEFTRRNVHCSWFK